MLWTVAMSMNFVMFLGYTAILLAFLIPLIRSRQLGGNPLGLATSVVFLTCAVHHGAHAVHMLLPTFGLDVAEGMAYRNAWSWPTVIWDIVTASAAVYYWTIRRSFGNLAGGAAIFDDLKAERRRAMEIHDNIVQGLAVAQLALSVDDRQKSMSAMQHSLRSARDVISDLLGEAGGASRLGPGDLARESAGTVLDQGVAVPARASIAK